MIKDTHTDSAGRKEVLLTNADRALGNSVIAFGLLSSALKNLKSKNNLGCLSMCALFLEEWRANDDHGIQQWFKCCFV